MSLIINNVYKAYEVYQPKSNKPYSRESRADENNFMFEFSSKAQEYNTAIKSISTTPDIRLENAENIKARMEAGKYEVSSNAIANKILAKYYEQL